MSDLKVTISQALLTLAASGETYGEVLAASGFDVGLYRPQGRDPQGPHKRDEIYVVATGTGTFLRGEERTECKPGDLLFVPAGVEHRFEVFSADFSTGCSLALNRAAEVAFFDLR